MATDRDERPSHTPRIFGLRICSFYENPLAALEKPTCDCAAIRNASKSNVGSLDVIEHLDQFLRITCSGALRRNYLLERGESSFKR